MRSRAFHGGGTIEQPAQDKSKWQQGEQFCQQAPILYEGEDTFRGMERGIYGLDNGELQVNEVGPGACHIVCTSTAFSTVQESETQFAVSPSTPLLSTAIDENSLICGKLHILRCLL